MKRVWYVNIALLIAFLLSIGCETTRKIQQSIRSVGSPAYHELFTQVPADMKDDSYKAEFDLRVSEQKIKLAKLKNKLAVKQENYSDNEVELAEKLYEEAEITLDIQKVEAIMKSGLGKKEENIQSLANLKTQKLRTRADRIKIEAAMETTQLAINDLLQQIEAQEALIKHMDIEEESVEEMITEEPIH